MWPPRRSLGLSRNGRSRLFPEGGMFEEHVTVGPRRGLRGFWTVQQVSLGQAAAEALQDGQLLRGLDALGDCLETEDLCQGDDGLHDRQVLAIVGEVGDE